jgi:hypothetical protein
MEAMASSSNTCEDEAGWRLETEALLQGPKASPPVTESPDGQMLRTAASSPVRDPPNVDCYGSGLVEVGMAWLVVRLEMASGGGKGHGRAQGWWAPSS